MELPVQVWLQGVFPAGTADYARRAILAVLRQVGIPVRGVRVRLSAYPDPAVHFPVVAQVVLRARECVSVSEHGNALASIRAQVRAATGREAIDLLAARLQHQLERAADPLPRPLSSRRTMPPNPWVARYPRPPQARQLVRHKPYHLAMLDVDGAAAELERRDYDFHLFTESGSGQDSVVYHAGPTGYRLAQLLPAPELIAPHTVELTWYGRPAPRLHTAEAVEQLGMCEVPFLFFRDLDRDRGSLLYRRYDGHYGLICARRRPLEPAEPTERGAAAGAP